MTVSYGSSCEFIGAWSDRPSAAVLEVAEQQATYWVDPAEAVIVASLGGRLVYRWTVHREDWTNEGRERTVEVTAYTAGEALRGAKEGG